MRKSDRETAKLSHIAPKLRAFAVPVEKIKPDPENARLHPEHNLQAIKKSLLQFGQQKPIVIAAGGVALAGNGVLLAAKQLGWTHVAAVRTNLKAAKIRAYAIADNRTGELSQWGDELLAAQLRELQADGIDPEAVGFWEEELAELLNQGIQDGLTDPDDVPEPPDEATTQPGDLWILGDHRLLCGDSAKPEDVDRLLDGAKIHLANCDPPYGVHVEPRSNNAVAAGNSSFQGSRSKSDKKAQLHHQGFDEARFGHRKPTHKKLRAKDRPLENDFVSDEEFDRLLRAWFGNIARVLEPGRGFFVWGGYANLANYPAALKECGLYFSQGIVWDKQHPVLTRKDFMGAFELAFYGWREGAAHKFFGPNNATDLWHVKKVNPQSMIHLTEKPVELAVRAITYSSRPGENVLDLFGGSGSTLIGCEQTGRKAYLMELDPLYCDVIVQRYEQFTGKKAEVIKATAKVVEAC